MDEIYHSIRSSVSAQIKIDGSRFIADAIPVVDEAEAQEHLEGIRKKYFDATHHCFAYIMGAGRTIVRYSDDGEPSGTAGVKIYSALLSKQLSDILIVVTRYFGGIKLGVGRLGRAYFDASAHVIESAEIIAKGVMNVVVVTFAFDDTNAVMKTIHSNKFNIAETQYAVGQSILHVLVPPSRYKKFHSQLTNATRARAGIALAGEQTVIL
jgi:uncharacterized YigZ family protein